MLTIGAGLVITAHSCPAIVVLHDVGVLGLALGVGTLHVPTGKFRRFARLAMRDFVLFKERFDILVALGSVRILLWLRFFLLAKLFRPELPPLKSVVEVLRIEFGDGGGRVEVGFARHTEEAPVAVELESAFARKPLVDARAGEGILDQRVQSFTAY